MELIITKSIKEKEWKPLEKIVTWNVLKTAAKKSLDGLGIKVKNSIKIPKTCLQKIHITTPGGAGRAIFLLQINDKKTVLVMMRLKNDKRIGANMAIENQRFKKELEKNLDDIVRDLQSKNYEKYEL